MNLLYEWASRGLLPSASVEPLGAELGLLPSRADWRVWLDRMLLIAGALLLGTGLVFFIASNWGELGRYGKFALAQVALLGGVAIYMGHGDRPIGRAGLGFSILAIGALFALYGQTYQTGADPWQLFATWAVCALPLVWLARAAPVWLLWLALVDVGLVRWLSFQVGRWDWLSEVEILGWALILVHILALLLAEGQRERVPRYARQLLYVALLWPLTSLTVLSIFDTAVRAPALNALAWAGLAVASIAWYRRARFDVVPLAFLSLGGVLLVTLVLAEAMDEYDNPLAWLALATACVLMTGAAGAWLLRRVRSERAGSQR